ncbi:MAG: DNA-processing protein DprA [Paludibacteraceae bacterium]|nr:DNA-processing protein DprA [Paludibacteraceae bacterium]
MNKNLDEAYSLEEYCVRKRIKILHYGAKDYPKALTNLKNPPIILYVRGQMDRLTGKLCLGVVGTRYMTDYGRDAAYRMGYELASAGAVVVS